MEIVRFVMHLLTLRAETTHALQDVTATVEELNEEGKLANFQAALMTFYFTMGGVLFGLLVATRDLVLMVPFVIVLFAGSAEMIRIGHGLNWRRLRPDLAILAAVVVGFVVFYINAAPS